MTIETQIREIAAEIARNAQNRISALERELTEIEARKTQIEAALNTARLSPNRLADFRVKIGADYQCPRCWIERKTQSALEPIGGGTAREDFFRCSKCQLDLSISL